MRKLFSISIVYIYFFYLSLNSSSRLISWEMNRYRHLSAHIWSNVNTKHKSNKIIIFNKIERFYYLSIYFEWSKVRLYWFCVLCALPRDQPHYPVFTAYLYEHRERVFFFKLDPNYGIFIFKTDRLLIIHTLNSKYSAEMNIWRFRMINRFKK